MCSTDALSQHHLFRVPKSALLWSLAYVLDYTNTAILLFFIDLHWNLCLYQIKRVAIPISGLPCAVTFVSPLNASELPKFASNNILTDNMLPKPNQKLSKSSRQHYWWQMVNLHISPNCRAVLEMTLSLYDYVGQHT